MYNHSLDVEGRVRVADLDFWVPDTSAFTTASTTVPIMLRAPNATASTVVSDYENPGNVEGTVSTTLNLGGARAGNGWIAIGIRKYFTTLAMRLQLDDGYFAASEKRTDGQAVGF